MIAVRISHTATIDLTQNGYGARNGIAEDSKLIKFFKCGPYAAQVLIYYIIFDSLGIHISLVKSKNQ